MVFSSILFRTETEGALAGGGEPEFFRDLNLDQLVASLTSGRDEYNLKPYFYQRLDDVDAIRARSVPADL